MLVFKQMLKNFKTKIISAKKGKKWDPNKFLYIELQICLLYDHGYFPINGVPAEVMDIH